MRKKCIREFLKTLNPLSKILIEYYINKLYVPKVRTGLGKYENFVFEHDSKKGIEIVKELIKFKTIQFNSGYYKNVQNNKKVIDFVTNSKNHRSIPKNRNKI